MMVNPPEEKGNMDADAAADQLSSMSIGGEKSGDDVDATSAKSNFGGNVAGTPARLPEQFCSSCGKTGIAKQDLKRCNGCKCVWYCGAACQKAHWKAHKKECKRIGLIVQERAKLGSAFQKPDPDSGHEGDYVERDGDAALFAQPVRDDCDICMRVLPIETSLSMYMPCCGKMVCCGCFHECGLATQTINEKRAKKNQDLLKSMCAFCRQPIETSIESMNRQMEIGAERGDPQAMKELALHYRDGDLGLPVDHNKALVLLRQSADLGNAHANYLLGMFYANGDLGLDVDEAKTLKYFELAAKAGNIGARYNLGQTEHYNGSVERAIRHWRLAAAAGCDEAVMRLMSSFEEGVLTLEELARYMQARDKASIEINSDERNRAKKILISIGMYTPYSHV